MYIGVSVFYLYWLNDPSVKCNSSIRYFMITKGIISIHSSYIQKVGVKGDGTVVDNDPNYTEVNIQGGVEDITVVKIEETLLFSVS